MAIPRGSIAATAFPTRARRCSTLRAPLLAKGAAAGDGARPGLRYTGPMQTHDRAWERYFVAHGYPAARPLAAGIEGAVYRLGRGRGGKVWARRSVAELAPLRRAYRDIAAQAPPFATPAILALVAVRGVPVTIERALPGRPLEGALGAGAAALAPAARRCPRPGLPAHHPRRTAQVTCNCPGSRHQLSQRPRPHTHVRGEHIPMFIRGGAKRTHDDCWRTPAEWRDLIVVVG